MKLYETLFILTKSTRSINVFWEYLKNDEEENCIPNVLKTHLYFLINLETNIFFEEYNRDYKLLEEKFHQKIKEVRKIAKPIVQKISRTWPGLQSFRNNFVAHPWRDSKGNFCVPDYAENVPKNSFDFQVLISFINYIDTIIKTEFKVELDKANIYVSKTYPTRISGYDYTNLNDEIIQMIKEVCITSNNLKKMYLLKPLLFDLEIIKKN